MCVCVCVCFSLDWQALYGKVTNTVLAVCAFEYCMTVDKESPHVRDCIDGLCKGMDSEVSLSMFK